MLPHIRLDRAARRLEAEGFDDGPDPSRDFLLTEGDVIEISFHNNVKCTDDGVSAIRIVFNSNFETSRYFTMSESNQYLQKQLNTYRGLIHVAKICVTNEDLTIVNEDGDIERKMSETITQELIAVHNVNIPKVLVL